MAPLERVAWGRVGNSRAFFKLEAGDRDERASQRAHSVTHFFIHSFTHSFTHMPQDEIINPLGGRGAARGRTSGGRACVMIIYLQTGQSAAKQR